MRLLLEMKLTTKKDIKSTRRRAPKLTAAEKLWPVEMCEQLKAAFDEYTERAKQSDTAQNSPSQDNFNAIPGVAAFIQTLNVNRLGDNIIDFCASKVPERTRKQVMRQLKRMELDYKQFTKRSKKYVSREKVILSVLIATFRPKKVSATAAFLAANEVEAPKSGKHKRPQLASDSESSSSEVKSSVDK